MVVISLVYSCFLCLLYESNAVPVNIFGHELDISSKSDNEIEYVNTVPLNTETPSYDTRLEMNVSKILDSLIASHDRRIRPNYGGPATQINVSAHIITISAISEVSMDYTLDLYLRQFWIDKRLAFASLNNDNTTSSMTVGIDMVKSIWVPDSFFPNEKKSFFHETTSHNSFLRIDNHGQVLRSIRLTVTANCPMNLQSFPLDIQVCALEIESYGYSTTDIIYHWANSNPVVMDKDVHLAHFEIGPHYHIERTVSLSTGNYSRLTTYFTFKRNIGFYLIQIYLPSSLIVVISWVSFWLNREATQARVTIGVTTVLTQTTLMTSTNASLPKVSYVKSLDVFLGVCFLIVFLSLIEYAFVGYLMKRQRSASNSKNSAQLVCYYEYEDQPLASNNRRTSSLRRQSKNKPSNNGVGIEQSMPLLSLSPTGNNSNPGSARLSIVGPAPNLQDCRVDSNYKIRPSKVDLFSRVCFPLSFIIFNLVYWSIYLNPSP